MEKLVIREGLRISNSPYGGVGVFTDQKIKEGDIVEECHTLNIPITQKSLLPRLLQYYVYFLVGGDEETIIAIPLGFGMIYNHSKNQNVTADQETILLDGKSTIIFRFCATRDINVGEELLTNYGPYYFNRFDLDEI